MIKKEYLLILILVSFGLLSFVEKESYSLTISVTELKNSRGVVMFFLYNEEGSIPDKHLNKYYKKGVVIIEKEVATITFDNISEGKYAVSIIHDENNNAKVDKRFILPIEGVGFSKYQSINLRNRPSFSKASFELNTDLGIDIKTIYM